MSDKLFRSVFDSAARSQRIPSKTCWLVQSCPQVSQHDVHSPNGHVLLNQLARLGVGKVVQAAGFEWVNHAILLQGCAVSLVVEVLVCGVLVESQQIQADCLSQRFGRLYKTLGDQRVENLLPRELRISQTSLRVLPSVCIGTWCPMSTAGFPPADCFQILRKQKGVILPLVLKAGHVGEGRVCANDPLSLSAGSSSCDRARTANIPAWATGTLASRPLCEAAWSLQAINKFAPLLGPVVLVVPAMRLESRDTVVPPSSFRNQLQGREGWALTRGNRECERVRQLYVKHVGRQLVHKQRELAKVRVVDLKLVGTRPLVARNKWTLSILLDAEGVPHVS